MITLIIIIIITLFIATFFTWVVSEKDLTLTIVNSIVFTGIIAIFMYFLIALMSANYIQNHKSEFSWKTEKIGETNIRTLSDNTNNISGTFGLGFGAVNSVSKFYFYAYASDSSFYLKSIKSDDVKIIESSTKNPCVVKYKKYVDWAKSKISNWKFKTDVLYEYYYIYVPKNTVIIKYNLDAQ